MIEYCHICTEHSPKVIHPGKWCNFCIPDRHTSNLDLGHLLPGTYDKHLRFGVIQLEELVTHPDADIKDTQINLAHCSIGQDLYGSDV